MSTENKKLNGRDAVQAIVQRYLTGDPQEAEDMVNELMALHTVSIQSSGNELDEWRHEVQCRFDQQSASLSTSVGEMVKDAIRAELQPGGLVHAAITR